MHRNPKNVYYFDLNSDERVLLLLRQHVVTTVPWLLGSLVMAALPLVLAWAVSNMEVGFAALIFSDIAWFIAAVWYLFTLGFLLESFIVWYFNVYILTTKRLVDVDVGGIMHRDIAETPLINVQDVTFRSQGIAATVFNFGDVFVQTASVQPEFDFHNVPEPARVHDIITDEISTYKHHGKSKL